jgi:hypothetical protein
VSPGRAAPPPRLTQQVLDFRPSRHGLHFPNRFPPGPTVVLGPIDPSRFGIGDASGGLCGGMALTVADLFAAGIEPPPDREVPANGSRRHRALVRRQVQSLGWFRVPLRFWSVAAFRPEAAAPWSRLLRRASRLDLALDHAWPRIRDDIDAGRPALVGLVRTASLNPLRLVTSHQVLAYGYRTEPGLVSIRVYDPNWPDRDDVELRVHLAGNGRPASLDATTGEPLVGILSLPVYLEQPRAWLRSRVPGAHP